MNAIDAVIIVLALVMGAWGATQGLFVSAITLGGLLGGAVLGTRLAGLLLSGGSESRYAALIGLVCALSIGALTALLLERLAISIRRSVKWKPARAVDVAGGIVFGAALALGLAWIVGAVLLQTPGASTFRGDMQRSAVLKELNGAMPPSGPLLELIARIDPFPRIAGPPANVAPPNAAILDDRDVDLAARSVVRVFGTACGLGVEGSGWVAMPETVVTNAHVIAGESETQVQVGGTGPSLEAHATAFDVHNDIAVLSVPGLDLPPLARSRSSAPETPGAIIGYPLGGPLNLQPARLGETASVYTQNAYGQGQVTRTITSIRGEIRHGNSGGPVVNRRGEVMATIFASRQDSEGSGYGVPNSIVARELSKAKGPVGTGQCTS